MDVRAVRTALGIMTLEQGSRSIQFCETELPGMFDTAVVQYQGFLTEAGIKVSIEDLQQFKSGVLDDVRRFLELKGMIR